MSGFRQPGDLGRYVAFNDPGQPGAGFSSYEEYLNAGNKPFHTSNIPTKLGGGLNSLVSQPQQQLFPIKLGGSQGNMGTSPSGQLAGGFGGIVNNNIRPYGAMIPEQGPLGPGLVGGTTPQTGINLPGNLGTPMGTVNNNIRGGGDFTLKGMTQQPMQQPMQNPLGGGLSSLNQQPFGGGFNSFNQQPFGGGFNSFNQQPQQMNGGLKGILDNYISNYLNNYFMNALK